MSVFDNNLKYLDHHLLKNSFKTVVNHWLYSLYILCMFLVLFRILSPINASFKKMLKWFKKIKNFQEILEFKGLFGFV